MEENANRLASSLSSEISGYIGGDGSVNSNEMIDFTRQFINLLDAQDDADDADMENMAFDESEIDA